MNSKQWRAQADPSGERAPNKILYSFVYTPQKFIGDSLTVVDKYLQDKKKSSITVWVTNIFLPSLVPDIEYDEDRLVCSVPAWAIPEVYLESFVPSMHRFNRIIVASDQRPDPTTLKNNKYFASDVFCDAEWLPLDFTTNGSTKILNVSKHQLIQAWYDMLDKTRPAIMIWITRANYGGSEPIDVSEGILNIDHVRVLGYNPKAWKYSGINFLTNQKLILDLWSQQPLVYLFESTPAVLRYTILSPTDGVKKFLSTRRPRLNITFKVIIDADGMYQQLVRHFVLVNDQHILLPLDNVCLVNELENTSAESSSSWSQTLHRMNADFGEDRGGSGEEDRLETRSRDRIKTIQGYPCFVLSKYTNVEALPPHLRSLALALLDTKCKVKEIESPIKNMWRSFRDRERMPADASRP